MKNKFKNNERVVVNGYGKLTKKVYKNKKGFVILRDTYYLDYNVRLDNGIEDWFDGNCLRKMKRRRKIG